MALGYWRSAELRIPLVPSTAPARRLCWALLALCALAPLSHPAAPPQIAWLGGARGCVLGWQGAGPACACDELSGPLRRLFALPLPLNRAAAIDLEALPGIGPVRAQAIVVERERGGAFEHVDELVRVPGLGRLSVERLRHELFVGAADPACVRAKGAPMSRRGGEG